MSHANLNLHEEEKNTQDIVTRFYTSRESSNEMTADFAVKCHALYE